jgi:hypothetical protein
VVQFSWETSYSVFRYCFKKSSYCSALEETMHNHILDFISYCLYAGIVLILGGGPNRIGQGIEFDYCCCHASFVLQVQLKKLHFLLWMLVLNKLYLEGIAFSYIL